MRPIYDISDEWEREVLSQANSVTGNGEQQEEIKWVEVDKPGEYRFIVLPPWDEKGRLGVISAKHYGLVDKNNKEVSHVCVEVSFPEKHVKCPICEVIRKFEPYGASLVARYKPNPRAYINVKLLSSPAYQGSSNSIFNVPKEISNHAMVLRHTPTTLTWILQRRKSPDYGNLIDPHRSRIIKITKTGNGLSTKYFREIVGDPMPIGETEEEIDYILSTVYNLSNIFKYPTDDILLKIKEDAERLEQLLSEKVKQLAQSDSKQVNIPFPPTFTTVKESSFTSAVESGVSSNVAVSTPVTNVRVGSEAEYFVPVGTSDENVVKAINENRSRLIDSFGFKKLPGAPACFGDAYKFGKIPQCRTCIVDIECKSIGIKIQEYLKAHHE